MIGVAFVLLGTLLVLSAVFGARVRGRDRGMVAAFLLSPLDPTSWQATLAIIGGFWLLLFAFALILTLFSAGTSLLVVGIGVAFIGLAIEGCRFVARLERSRAAYVDHRPLRAHAYRPYGNGIGDLLVALFADVNRWRDVLYILVAFPLAILEFVVSVGLWVGALALICTPFIVDDPGVTGGVAGLGPQRELAIAVGVIVGVVLLFVAATVSRGLMALHRAVVEGLLCESEARALARRVQTLETSRRAVIDVEATELRRIERDLHDGAQQRLVMLTIDLGLAADKIETDPAAARTLVAEAQDQARQALAELRDLVRGIAPAILLDRGLVPALSAIAGRCPVPTVVSSTLAEGERLPDAAERAAYFVAAEALANVAKHAAATRCEIRCRREGSSLVIEVWDDGAGGARIIPGGGLAGLAGRVEALDGSLTVDSPETGPTTVRAAIPVPAVAPEPPPPPPPPPAPATSWQVPGPTAR